MHVTEKTTEKQFFTVSPKVRTRHDQWNNQVAGFNQQPYACTCT